MFPSEEEEASGCVEERFATATRTYTATATWTPILATETWTPTTMLSSTVKLLNGGGETEEHRQFWHSRRCERSK